MSRPSHAGHFVIQIDAGIGSFGQRFGKQVRSAPGGSYEDCRGGPGVRARNRAIHLYACEANIPLAIALIRAYPRKIHNPMRGDLIDGCRVTGQPYNGRGKEIECMVGMEEYPLLTLIGYCAGTTVREQGDWITRNEESAAARAAERPRQLRQERRDLIARLAVISLELAKFEDK